MAGNQAQRIVLGDRGKGQLCLHHGKGVADALARASPKGKIGEARATSRTFRRETLRVEYLRFLPEGRMTMRAIGAEKNHTFGGNSIAANDILVNSKTCKAKSRRVETHGFLNHHTRIG